MEFQPRITLASAPSGICDFWVSETHSIFKRKNGQLLGVGSNSSGQLGIEAQVNSQIEYFSPVDVAKKLYETKLKEKNEKDIQVAVNQQTTLIAW